MNRDNRLLATALAGVCLSALFALPLAAAEPNPWRFSLDLGGIFADISGDRTSKAEEYRDLSDGALLDNGVLDFENAESPWSFDMTADNVGRRDQRAGLRWGLAGRFRVDASWVQTPHFLSEGATSLWTRSGGNLEIPDAVQGQIESFFTATPAPNTAQARTFMNGILAQNAHTIDLETRRDTGKVKADFDITQHWSVAVAAKDESKSGTGRIGSGTYIRRQTVNSFDRNRFEPRSNELPMPVDWKDRSYGLGTGFHHQGWFFNAGWQESSFTNSIGSLTWDNPFEGLPGATSSRTGLTPGSDQEPSGATANTNNRGRFAQAQLDLYPDNDYERFNMTGGVNLPARTRVNASYSAATMKQNDPFLAYTINPAVIYGNGADGIGGTPDDVLAKDVALPRASLDGEVQTTRLDLRVTSRPLDPLSLRGAYRVYEYDDKTPSILFPGYASAGDSYFRPGVGQRNAAGTRVLFNEPGGYKRTSWSVGGAWRFGDPATLDVEYVNTGMDYDERQVKSTSEEQLSAKLRLAFGENFEARLTYLDASRDADGIYHVGFETSRLRAFDVWNRDRTRYGAELTWMLAEGTTLGFVYQNWQDDFPGVLPEPTPPSTSNPYPSQAYGLNETANDSLALSLSHGAENWNLSLSVGLDSSKWTSEATAKTTLTADSPQFSPTNAWRRTQDDDVLWAGLAFDAKLGAKGKLDIQIDYNDYKGSYDTVNLGTPTINDGVAYAVPDFSSSLLSGQIAYSWELNEHFGFGAKYLYEPYKLDDWQWDLVEPYMQGILKETGGSPGAVRDATANRSLFLDSTYSDYTANVFALFVTIHY